MRDNQELETYWISFPLDPNLPFGIGVTALSEEDAFALLRQQGIDSWIAGAKQVHVRNGVRIADLDQRNVRPNIGPMQFRGVWYPAMNIGWGAPRGADFRSLPRRGA